MSATRPKVSIRMVKAEGGPETLAAMGKEYLTCGRQAELATADDPFVAPSQARFFFSGPRLAIEDVGGGNGVFVRLRQEWEVAAGSELRVGRQRLFVEPVQPVSQGPGGITLWGSPDPGYRFRLIQVLEGGQRGAAFTLKEGDNALGREAGDITFPSDGFVSGRHAMLQIRQGRLWVRDLGSSNGTFVRLTAPMFVDSGDQFLIGKELLRVEIDGAK